MCVYYTFRFTLYFMYSNWFNGMFIKDIYLYVCSCFLQMCWAPFPLSGKFFPISFIFSVIRTVYGLRAMPFYVPIGLLEAASRCVLITHAAQERCITSGGDPGVSLQRLTYFLYQNHGFCPAQLSFFLRHLPTLLLPSCSLTIHAFPILSHLYHFTATTYYLSISTRSSLSRHTQYTSSLTLGFAILRS